MAPAERIAERTTAVAGAGLVFGALRRVGAEIAIASSSTADRSAKALLSKFGLVDDESVAGGGRRAFIEMASGDEEGREERLKELCEHSAIFGPREVRGGVPPTFRCGVAAFWSAFSA